MDPFWAFTARVVARTHLSAKPGWITIKHRGWRPLISMKEHRTIHSVTRMACRAKYTGTRKTIGCKPCCSFSDLRRCWGPILLIKSMGDGGSFSLLHVSLLQQRWVSRARNMHRWEGDEVTLVCGWNLAATNVRYQPDVVRVSVSLGYNQRVTSFRDIFMKWYGTFGQEHNNGMCVARVQHL